MPAVKAPAEEHPHARPPEPEGSTLHVGPADDQYERAADRAADRALRRLAETGGLGEPGRGGAAVRRRAVEVGHEGGAPPPDTSRRIEAARGSGSPLPDDVRRPMETAFGTDFGRVRLHAGADAADLSGRLGATAFSVGRDVFLGGGTPALDTADGQHLLAHELAHTMQQSTTARRLFGLGKKKAAAEETRDWKAADRPDRHSSVNDSTRHGEANAWGEGLKEGMTAPGDTGYYNPWYDNLAKSQGEERSDKTIASTPTDNLTYASVGTSTFALALDMSRTIEVFMKGSEDPDERIRAVYGLLGSMSATAESTAYTVQAAEGGADSASDATNAAAGYLTAITAGLTAVKSGSQTVVDIVKLIEAAGELSDSEKTTASIAVIRQALETAKGVIDSINQLWSMTGTVTTAMLQAAPALGIAINVLDVISNGVNLGYSTLAWGEMRKDKRAVKEKLQGPRDLARNKGKTKWGNKSFAKEAKEILAAVEGSQSVTMQFDDETVRNSKDYLLLKNLQRVAAKRIRRAALNIGATLPAIAGDIAVLSGLGAGAGVGLKAASGGIKLGAALVRLGKQKYHDVKGDSKSTENKLKMYDGMIARMIDNLIKANEMPVRKTPSGDAVLPDLFAQDDAQEAALRAITASGMTPGIMKKYRATVTDPNRAEKGQELYKAWVDALRKR